MKKWHRRTWSEGSKSVCGGRKGVRRGSREDSSGKRSRISIRTRGRLYFVAFSFQLPDNQDIQTDQVPSYDKMKH